MPPLPRRGRSALYQTASACKERSHSALMPTPVSPRRGISTGLTAWACCPHRAAARFSRSGRTTPASRPPRLRWIRGRCTMRLERQQHQPCGAAVAADRLEQAGCLGGFGPGVGVVHAARLCALSTDETPAGRAGPLPPWQSHKAADAFSLSVRRWGSSRRPSVPITRPPNRQHRARNVAALQQADDAAALAGVLCRHRRQAAPLPGNGQHNQRQHAPEHPAPADACAQVAAQRRNDPERTCITLVIV